MLSVSRRGKMKEEVCNILAELGVPVIDVKVEWDEHLGEYIVVIVNSDARQALESWLRIIESLGKRLHRPIFVMWTGNMNVSPEELGAYIGKALARMGIFLSTTEPIDAAKLLEEKQ